jgi:glycosyl transferase family 87
VSRAALRARLAPVLKLPWGEAATLIFIVIRLGLVFFYVDRQSTPIDGDINRYYDITKDGVPYRDQAVEYPPVTVGVLELIHLFARERHAFGIGVVLTMALIEALVCVLMWRSFGNRVGLTFLILDAPLYYLLLTRVDIISVALAALFVALLLGRRQLGAGVAWVAAVGAKLWPLPLGVYLLTGSRSRREQRRALVGAAAGATVLAGVWLAIGGIDGVRQVITFRGSQGWHIESIVGNVVRIVSGGRISVEEGAYRIGHVPSGLGVVMLLVGTATAIAVCAWAGRQNRPGVGWVTAVMCLLVTATLASPQFVIWAIPGAALAMRESRPWLVGTFAITVGVTYLESRFYGTVIDGSLAGNGLVLARNVGLVLTLLVGVQALRRGGGSSPAPAHAHSS